MILQVTITISVFIVSTTVAGVVAQPQSYTAAINKNNATSMCVPNHVAECSLLGYTHTKLPNLMGMFDQSEASVSMTSFNPLINYGCSSQLRVLLCGFYAPMCSPVIGGRMIPPCQNLCLSVRQRCAPVMFTFGYLWPLNCSILPINNTATSICMDGPGEIHPPLFPPPPLGSGGTDCKSPHCRCEAIITYNSQDKEYATVWIAIWGVVCCGVTLFCLVSFIISQTRYGFRESSAFTYPDRCGVHLIICYFMISIGYLLRMALGPSLVSCRGSGSPADAVDLNASCLLVFMVLYYFNNAAAVWWVMLCLCWLLGAWRRFHHAMLVRYSVYMHAVSWALPAILTVGVLIRRHTELYTDDLTGICSPANNSPLSLVKWVLAPQLLLLMTGSTLLLLTFACLYRDHNTLHGATATGANRYGTVTKATVSHMKADNDERDREQCREYHEVVENGIHHLPPSLHAHLLRRPAQVAVRIGVLTMLYMIPAICKVAALFHESEMREAWLEDPYQRPSIETFMFKIFCSLAPGILLSLFLANSRGIQSLPRLGQRFYSTRSKGGDPYTLQCFAQKQQSECQLCANLPQYKAEAMPSCCDAKHDSNSKFVNEQVNGCCSNDQICSYTQQFTHKNINNKGNCDFKEEEEEEEEQQQQISVRKEEDKIKEFASGSDKQSYFEENIHNVTEVSNSYYTDSQPDCSNVLTL